MLPDLSYFHFLRPAWGLLLLPSVALLWFLWRQPGDQQRFAHIIAPHLLAHLRVHRQDQRWFNPRSITCILLVLLTLILMGPSWRQQPSPLQQDRSNLILLLDSSASMAQRDIQPSRIARARQKITDLLALSPDRRAAIVAFAGSAHTVLSLTADRDILHQYLAATGPRVMPRPGKFPEYALPRVDDLLRDRRGPATVLLLADGVGSDSIAAFEEYFAQRPHQLLVLGVGSDAVSEDEVPLEREALRELARRSGGDYLDLSIDRGDVTAIDRAIGRHYVPVADTALPWHDSGYPLLFPAMLLFLLWFRRGWTLAWLWLPGLIWLTPVDSARAQVPALPALAAEEPATVAAPLVPGWFLDLWLTPGQQGRLLLEYGRYQAAAHRFRDPLWKGVALYYAENFQRAAEYFSRADSDVALFNEANARAHGRDYLRAVACYDRLLARSPDYPGARANRERVQTLVDANQRLSESQRGEPGEHSEELGEEQPRASEGAERQVWDKAQLEQLTAEDLLASEATRDMWLRGVQKDPASFLASKFAMQLGQREAEQ